MSDKPDLAKKLKNISEKDRKQIEQAQEMLGPDPATMGFVKNFFWGNCRQDLAFPYPEVSAEETARCDQLLAELDEYMKNEHPSVEIDQNEEIPEWAIKKFFDLGVMGMIIPPEYGGGGFGVTSYNRVLQRIGESCGSSAVMVSAHQSIGCGALNLFGTEDQKKRFLPHLANDYLSAFCLSEPNVGCDAGGQETIIEKDSNGDFIIKSGEKKWATSGAIAGFFTVMGKQMIEDPKTGKVKPKITALIVTPDMAGMEIFSRNRSKVCIRGTWQARIRFNNVKVPKENLLHKEGRGINVALTCLNWGRCTLAAGMVGAARTALKQAGKWARYRYQFDRPIGEFELVQSRLATMYAELYAMDAMLYMTTGMLDRGDEDIMLETALCKVFCSEMGFDVTNHAVQIMGGEAFATENELDRLWRDSRINSVVEGANEVMRSFVFAYGSKQLGEAMMAVQAAPLKHLGQATQIASELFLGIRRGAPGVDKLSPKLAPLTRQLEMDIREFSHQVKMMFKEHKEKLITNQMIQARLADCALWLYANCCVLSRADQSIRKGVNGKELEDELAVVSHACAMGSEVIANRLRELRKNTDETMRPCAQAALAWVDQFPNSEFSIPEKTPDKEAFGTGKKFDETHIKQFGAGSIFKPAGTGA
ncbi:MAG: acyl-CoA dehydrogenase family protein [Phycisphaerales bacterium]|nr:MAG: acyl-CoA dehydrogenase family protein [Phycisphaerales bacterium]